MLIRQRFTFVPPKVSIYPSLRRVKTFTVLWEKKYFFGVPSKLFRFVSKQISNLKSKDSDSNRDQPETIKFSNFFLLLRQKRKHTFFPFFLPFCGKLSLISQCFLEVKSEERNEKKKRFVSTYLVTNERISFLSWSFTFH